MSLDSLHPYDDVERRFRDDDGDPARLARGRDLVAKLLGLPAPPAAGGLRYDLSFYSGGIGIIDRLYVALPCAAEVDASVAGLGHLTPEALAADEATREEFLWLLNREDGDERSLPALVRDFIVDERTDFQPVPDEGARVWFERCSGVNSWALVYEQDGRLCLIAYDQG